LISEKIITPINPSVMVVTLFGGWVHLPSFFERLYKQGYRENFATDPTINEEKPSFK